jgi:hypothetical protein
MREMYKSRVTGVALAIALLGSVACHTSSIKRLTTTHFPPKSNSAPIELYVGTVSRPHTALAIIQSKSDAKKDEKTKAGQLEELKRLARKLGADAVQEIRLLTKKAQGYVVDERVPFAAWKQGKYNLYFLRGTAIRYTEDSPVASETPLQQ